MPHWRNWIAHQTSNLGVVGSSPTWGILVVFPSLVKGVRLKIACYTLRGFKSPCYHVPLAQLVRARVL